MAEDTGKRVDEEWKHKVEAEKERIAEKQDDAEQFATVPEPDFPNLVSNYVTQALIGLGQFPDPISEKREVRLELAKHAIDTLQMLQEKTKGNLTDDEKKQLDAVLYDLRLRFLDAAG